MLTRRRLVLGVLAALLVAGAGVGAWWFSRPPPPVPVERAYGEIPREEYERWMQDLGYTE